MGRIEETKAFTSAKCGTGTSIDMALPIAIEDPAPSEIIDLRRDRER
jgi:hypothetical protein